MHQADQPSDQDNDSSRHLENAFYARHDAELIGQVRESGRETHDKEQLAQVTGIQDPMVLDELYRAGLDTETIAALCLVPLIEVAWADGHLDQREREAVMRAVDEEGIKQDTPAYRLIMEWMEHPAPELHQVWADYVVALCRAIPSDFRKLVRDEVIGRAVAVAGDGAFLKAEKQVISRLERVFDTV